MPTPIAELRQRIAAQRTDNPAMYGAVDFSIQPERLLLDGDIAGSELRSYPKVAAKLLENTELMERMAAGSVAKIVKLEHAWRRLDGRNDDGFQVAPFPG